MALIKSNDIGSWQSTTRYSVKHGKEQLLVDVVPEYGPKNVYCINVSNISTFTYYLFTKKLCAEVPNIRITRAYLFCIIIQLQSKRDLN